MSACVYAEPAARPSRKTCFLSSEAQTSAAESEETIATVAEILTARSVYVGASVGGIFVVGAGTGMREGAAVGCGTGID